MAKILIVEDDLSFGTLIQTWLRKKGFEVEKATSVKGALLLLEKDGDRDLILSDFRLPDHDGLAVLKWAQDHNLRIPFIVMTSYAEVQNAVLAMKAGATDYIAKPFQPDILLEKIQEALRAHASTQPPTPLSDASAPAAQPTMARRREETPCPATSKARARPPAGSMTSCRWWPPPPCQYSSSAPVVRERSMSPVASTS